MWQHAHRLVMSTYQATQEFPTREIYGLTAQMRRAAASIGSNICEACGKPTDAEFSRYLTIAFGSASELKYQFLLSRDLGFMAESVHADLEDQVDAVMRMLSGLIKKSRGPRVARAVPGAPRTSDNQQPTPKGGHTNGE